MDSSSTPDIDVVIPTLDCSTNIWRCLQRIRRQSYGGKIHILIVDGGSVDTTRDVSRKLAEEVILSEGNTPGGLEGQFQLGIANSSSDFIWHIDSDNFIVEDTAARSLMEPFLADDSINLSIPLLLVDPSYPSSFNHWLTALENYYLSCQMAQGTRMGDWFCVENLNHGIPNGTIIRRSALAAVGGYDMDVMVLKRLRSANLAKAAIVPNSHIFHNSAGGALQYKRKIEHRLNFHTSMSSDTRSRYFVDQAVRGKEMSLKNQVTSLFKISVDSIRNLARTRKMIWLWGIAYVFIVIAAVLGHMKEMMSLDFRRNA